MAQRRLTEARIALIVRAAVRAGLDVGGVEVTQDGLVRVLTQGQTEPTAANDVDEWFENGKAT